MTATRALLVSVALIAACGSRVQPPATAPTPTPSATPSPTPSGTPSPTPAPTGTPHVSPTPTSAGTVVSESSNGSTVTVRRGELLTVLLHSTYWTIAGSGDSAVLSSRGGQQTTPDPPGSCPPGVGCGTVSEQFAAVADGVTAVTASRTSCGEAMACQPAQRSYRVTVRVTG